jgi:hypothetical protein
MPSFMPSESVRRAFSVAIRVSQLQSGDPSALPSKLVGFSQAAFSVAIQVSQVSLQRRHPSQVSHGLLCQIDCNLVSPPFTLWGEGVPSVLVITVTYLRH